MIDNFDEMMEYVSGEKLSNGDFADLTEFKITSGKIILVRRKGQSNDLDGFRGEYFGSLDLENGTSIGFLCRDGSVRVLPE